MVYNKAIIKKLNQIVLFIVVLAFAFVVTYGFVINRSGHTSISPYYSLFIFIPVFLMGFIQLINERKGILILLVIISILGIVCIIFFDAINILLQYDVWINRRLV
jgi:hypothetical protein